MYLWGGSFAAAAVLFVVIQQLRPDPEVQVDGAGLAPDFALRATDGSTVRLSELRGRKVVVNFWATWCGPCRLELPSFASFSRANPDVVVLGVAVDSGTPAQLAAARKNLDIPYAVLINDGRVDDLYGVSSLPTTFIIDEQGRIRDAQVGPMFGPQLSWATR